MFVDSDDDDFVDDVQQYVQSQDWDAIVAEEEEDADTVVEFPDDDGTIEINNNDGKGHQLRMTRKQPAAGDFGCSDPEMSGPEWSSDEGTIVDDQDLHGEDIDDGEIVVENEEGENLAEKNEIHIPLNFEIVPPVKSEIVISAMEEQENSGNRSLLDDLLFSPIPLPSPKFVDEDEICVEAVPPCDTKVPNYTPEKDNDIVLPVEGKTEYDGDMSFLDSLLASSAIISTPKQQEEDAVPNPIPDNGFVPPGFATFEYDPETSRVNVWESQRQAYGGDFFLETSDVVPYKKMKHHRLMSIAQIDYIEKLYCGDIGAPRQDIAGFFKVPDNEVFAVGDFVKPLPDHWHVKMGPAELEEMTTHRIQEIICAAVNSRRKLDFVIGVDEEGNASGCFIDRMLRDVLMQAVEFAVTNEIEPPLNSLSVDLQMHQVGSVDDQKYIIRIVFDQVVTTLHCLANGLFFFSDGNGTQHVGSRAEAVKFLELNESYADVTVGGILLPNGCERLSSSIRGFSSASLALPLVAVLMGFASRKLLHRLI